LKGEQIPLAARTFAVVDAWDALRSNRPYRTAWTAEQVLDYLRAEAGKQFDPNIVSIFEAMRLDAPL
jgi:HD-GYP domain-containing protein (c-di-GMP phosphodiesterase class II)